MPNQDISSALCGPIPVTPERKEPKNAFIHFCGLTKHFGPTCALEDVNLAVERGSVLALLGPNGAGKSTLFGCLLGLTVPTRGGIRRKGQPVNDADRAGFGYLAERIALYPQRTVAENGAFFARLRGQSIAEFEEQLERVGLFGLRGSKVRQLSKGMLQRLGLAIALCGRPELLVLDEPFNGLDPARLDTLQTILLEERQRGATLLVSTHTIPAIEPLATHAAILLDGRLAGSGSLEELRGECGADDSLQVIYHRLACRRRAAEEVFA